MDKVHSLHDKHPVNMMAHTTEENPPWRAWENRKSSFPVRSMLQQFWQPWPEDACTKVLKRGFT